LIGAPGTHTAKYANLGTLTGGGGSGVRYLDVGGDAIYDLRGTTFDNQYFQGEPPPPAASSSGTDSYQPSKSVRFSAAHDGGGIFGGIFVNGYARVAGDNWGRRYPSNHGGQLFLSDHQSIHNFTVEGCRFDHCWDPIRFGGTDVVNNRIFRCWISRAFDDAIENDSYSSFTVEDCLIESAYVFISERGSASTPIAGRVNLVKNSLVQVKGHYSNHIHYQVYKLNSSSNLFTSINTIYWLDAGSYHNGHYGDPWLNLNVDVGNHAVNWSGNTIVWAGGGSYPSDWTVPPGTTVTTDTSVWTNAVAAWKAANPHVPRIAGVDD
jgi:hypothetical protein